MLDHWQIQNSPAFLHGLIPLTLARREKTTAEAISTLTWVVFVAEVAGSVVVAVAVDAEALTGTGLERLRMVTGEQEPPAGENSVVAWVVVLSAWQPASKRESPQPDAVLHARRGR